jgi:hypothetical protein
MVPHAQWLASHHVRDRDRRGTGWDWAFYLMALILIHGVPSRWVLGDTGPSKAQLPGDQTAVNPY